MFCNQPGLVVRRKGGFLPGFLMSVGTLGTTSPGLGREEWGGGATMSRLTQPKGMGQVAHNRGSLEDNYRIKSYKKGK
jgi:hypothetical protein